MAQYDVDDLRTISALTPDTLLAALKVCMLVAVCTVCGPTKRYTPPTRVSVDCVRVEARGAICVMVHVGYVGQWI